MPHLLNRRILTLLFLGFASGLPLALTTATLAAWYTEAGISLIGIGALTLVGQPYVYKFLWAPLMDRYLPPFLGRRRGWILVTQITLIILLIILAHFNPEQHATLMGIIALAIAFASASQDIGINAYQTDILPEEERAMGAAVSVLGYRIALLVSGAFALILADHVGWQITYTVMGWLMLIGVITMWWAPEIPAALKKPPSSLKQAVVEPFMEFFHRQGNKMALLMLAAIVLYKLGDAFALSLNTTFLLRGVGFSLSEVGVANKVVGLIANISGGILGGVLLTRLSLIKGLIGFGILQALSNLTYMWLAAVGHNFSIMIFAITSEYFCSGLGTTAFLALIMTLCHTRYSATQFALLTALSAIGRVYVGPSAAMMVDALGWTWFYFVSFIIALPGIWLIWHIRTFIQKPPLVD